MREFNKIFLAIFISILIWVYAKLNDEYSFIENLSVEYEVIAKNLTLLEGPESVVVKVSGKGLDLLKFKIEKPKLHYTLDGSKLEGNLEINQAYLTPKQNVSLTPIQPLLINYSLDKITKRVLPVSPIIRGNPKLGYVYLGWSIGEDVVVEGPRKVVNNLDSIPTYPIDITGKTRSFEVLSDIFTEGLNIKVNPRQVKVYIIVDSIINKEVPVFLNDTSLFIKIQGPSRIVSPIVSLKGHIFRDSLLVEIPENVVIIESPMHLKYEGY